MIGQGQIYNYDIFLESEDNFGKHNYIGLEDMSSIKCTITWIPLLITFSCNHGDVRDDQFQFQAVYNT